MPGGLLYTYTAGTSTPAATYSDSTLLTPNANPIVLDAAGRCVIYIDATSYKFTLKTAAGVTVWTQDNIQAVNVSSVGLGEIFVFGANSAALVTNTVYTTGATYDKIHPGSSVFSVDSATLTGTYVLEIVGVQNTAGTLTVALVNLDDGAPDTPMVTAVLTSTTGAVAISSAITFAASGAAKTYAIKAKTSANSAFVMGARIKRTV